MQIQHTLLLGTRCTTDESQGNIERVQVLKGKNARRAHQLRDEEEVPRYAGCGGDPLLHVVHRRIGGHIDEEHATVRRPNKKCTYKRRSEWPLLS